MTREAIPAPAEAVLRWIFRRDSYALTCELDLRTDSTCDVVVVPHWDEALSAAEHFDSLADAVLRHAEIARRLREAGWFLIEHVAPDHKPLAA